MFFLKRLRKDLLLEPHLLGRSLVKHVKDRVHDELEGSCMGRNGYIITIFEIGDEDLETGLVDMDTGALNISVSYLALLFRPFTNEVLDAVVTSASDETGFFSRVGPLVVFVSRYAMPEDISFDSTSGDCWKSDDGDIQIREGSIVRLRILGLTIEATSISAIGTIKDDYLGLLQDS